METEFAVLPDCRKQNLRCFPRAIAFDCFQGVGMMELVAIFESSYSALCKRLGSRSR